MWIGIAFIPQAAAFIYFRYGVCCHCGRRLPIHDIYQGKLPLIPLGDSTTLLPHPKDMIRNGCRTTGNVRFLFRRWLFFHTYAMMKKRGIAMTWKKLRKKYKMWQTLAVVFLILAILCGILQYGNWDKLCLQSAFFSVIMHIYVMSLLADAGSAIICWTLMSCSMGGTASSAVHLWRMRRRRNADFSEYA